MFEYNLAKQLLMSASGETIETVVINRPSEWTKVPVHQVLDTPISWSDAFPMLDYKYVTAYQCNGVIAWTDRSVICSQFVPCEFGAYMKFIKVPRDPPEA